MLCDTKVETVDVTPLSYFLQYCSISVAVSTNNTHLHINDYDNDNNDNSKQL